MANQADDKKLLVYLPTWRLFIVMTMYCSTLIQIGALIIFAIEQKPIHPVGNLLLVIGTGITALLGHYLGRRDLQRIRSLGGQLEITRGQVFVVVFCCAMVPGSLLFLVILSGV